jgi:HK97 family phage portal protein
MRVVTAAGRSVDVVQRGWPLAGLERPGYASASGDGQLIIDINGTTIGGDGYSALYKTNPWVNAAIRSIAWGISRMSLQVYELQSDGQRERVRWDLPGNGPGRRSASAELDMQLNTSAMFDRGGPQRRMRRTMTDYLVHGNALWTIEDDGLWHVSWSKVKVIVGENTPILGYEVTGSTGKRFYAPEQVIHFCAGDDPDGPLGVPPMSALRYTLKLHDALQRHLVHFFENAARPSANLKVEKGANKEVLTAIREQVRELYTSPDNAGKVIVTTGDWQSMTAGHDQSQIVELAKLSREEIAAVFRMPLPVLGVLDHAIKSNVKELREQYVRDVIGAWAPAIEDDIMAQLVRPNPTLRSVYVEFDQDVHLRPDLEGIADAFVALERTMTTNERRRKLNLPDLDYPEADTVPAVPGSSYLGIQAKPQPLPGLPGLPAGSGGEQGQEDPPSDDAEKVPAGDQQAS